MVRGPQADFRVSIKLRYYFAPLALLATLALAGCDSGWSAPRKEAGPVPLSTPGAPVTRLVKTRTAYDAEDRQLLWDEGNGPVPVEQRVESVIAAAPSQLTDQLYSTRKIPSPNADRRLDKPTFETWAVLVSLKPDVLIVTVRDLSPGNQMPFHNWDRTAPRAQYIYQHLEYIFRGGPDGRELTVYAGSLVPWSDEMYVVSPDPKVEHGRVKFENNQATILLPTGKLLLRHHEEDVDVSRE